MKESDQIREDEGYERTPYYDTEGVVTFGIGFTFITEEESLAVLRIRLINILEALGGQLHWYDNLPIEAKNIMLNMAYQLGLTGLLAFEKTLNHIRLGEWEEASIEMLDSKWARQTPNRAKRLSDRMRDI